MPDPNESAAKNREAGAGARGKPGDAPDRAPRDKDVERERLNPGQDTGGTGGAGARPGGRHDDNSNG